MACIDVALGAVGSADLVVTDAGTTETALGTVLSTADIRKADTNDAALGGIGTATDVQVAETAGDCLGSDCAEPGGDIPTYCYETSFPSCIQIKDYYDGMLAGCAACDADAGGAWDGTFTAAACNDAGSPHSQHWWAAAGSVDGKAPYVSFYVLWFASSYYNIYISCLTDAGDPNSDIRIWEGYKYDGDSPIGEYMFDNSDCNAGPATLCVEECPS
jgi:hypothetical protein